jgi:predicted nuclease of predicted toxin-antitoxin system
MNIVDTSGYKLAMADSLIYDSAKVANAIVWTQDKDFEGLPGVKYYAKNE